MTITNKELQEIAIKNFENRCLKESFQKLLDTHKIKLKSNQKKYIADLFNDTSEISTENTTNNIKEAIKELSIKDFTLKDAQTLAHRKLKEGLVPKESIKILSDPNLFHTIVIKEMGKKMAGEEDTRHVIFLSLCSIWVQNVTVPLNTFVNSESSAGKSYIAKRIYDFFPNELKEYRTKITPQAFTYWHNPQFEPDWTWDGKILLLEDIGNDLINSSPFKVMCSEGSTATIVKDQRAIDIPIKGKPCILLTTANTTPTREIQNRFNLVSLDESKEQTHNVNLFTTKTMIGDLEEYDKDIRNSLRFLQIVDVKIPFAEKLVNFFPINNIRVRRDYPRFCNLIRASAAFHQFQRDMQDGSIVANSEDYENARKAIRKLQMTETMTSLTHRERKALESCIKLTEEKPEGFKVVEAWKKNPFVSERQWYRVIQKLLQLDLLTIDLVEQATGRSVPYYKTVKSGYFNLPRFEDI